MLMSISHETQIAKSYIFFNALTFVLKKDFIISSICTNLRPSCIRPKVLDERS